MSRPSHADPEQSDEEPHCEHEWIMVKGLNKIGGWSIGDGEECRKCHSRILQGAVFVGDETEFAEDPTTDGLSARHQPSGFDPFGTTHSRMGKQGVFSGWGKTTGRLCSACRNCSNPSHTEHDCARARRLTIAFCITVVVVLVGLVLFKVSGGV